MVFLVKLQAEHQELPHVSPFFTNVYHFSCFNLHFSTLFHRFSPGPKVAALQLPGLRAQRGARAFGGARRGAAEAAPAHPDDAKRRGTGRYNGWVGGTTVGKTMPSLPPMTGNGKHTTYLW
jgi:hypothetical protein